MNPNINQVVVITTINSLNHNGLTKLIQNTEKQNYLLLIVGDAKTNIKLESLEFPLVKYYDLKDQADSNFLLSGSLPLNHYARKNLGYLYAAQVGSEWISETDDDNFFYPKFWETSNEQIEIRSISNSGWVNVYKAFGIKNIWHRGIPIDEVPASNEITLTKTRSNQLVSCVQGMADGDPDVDAICRILFKPSISFPNKTFVIKDGSYAPTNSQLTRWHVQRSLALLYLPSTISWRVCDIWRGLIAQRFFWLTNMVTEFKGSVGHQVRNNHDLLKDFVDEFQVHRDTNKLIKILEGIEKTNVYEYMSEVYSTMLHNYLVDDLELVRLSHWIKDVQTTLNIASNQTAP